MKKIRECTYIALLACLLALACGCGDGNSNKNAVDKNTQSQSAISAESTEGETGVLDGLADDLRDGADDVREGAEDVKNGVERGVDDMMDRTAPVDETGSVDVTSSAK